MKFLDNSDKHLLAILPGIITEKLNKEAVKIKFIGGGSYGRVYKVFLSDGETIAVKGYKPQKMHTEEAYQLDFLSKNTSVKMPAVLFTYEEVKKCFSKPTEKTVKKCDISLSKH